MGEWSEIRDALAVVLSGNVDTRKLLMHRHRDIRVRLVIAILDVESRIMFLDP